MPQYLVALKANRERVRLIISRENKELLRACLPPPSQFWSCKPVKALLESLAIWLDARLRVVLYADDPADGFSLELTDELGTGIHTVFYEVMPVERKRQRPARLRGIGVATFCI